VPAPEPRIRSGAGRSSDRPGAGRRLALPVALVALLLTGCAGPAASHPHPTAVPRAAATRPVPATSTPTPDVPKVPVISAAIPNVIEPVIPIRIRIPAAGVSMPVVPVGVLPDGGLQLPDHPTTAGWYRYGPTPGASAGSTLIAAHVDTIEDGLGPFYKLRFLKAGTLVRISTSDGRTLQYAVQRVVHAPQQRLPLTTIFGRGGPARLTLVTCGGTYDAATHKYSDNVLVYARPLSS
jgi:hypothetical protein